MSLSKLLSLYFSAEKVFQPASQKRYKLKWGKLIGFFFSNSILTIKVWYYQPRLKIFFQNFIY